MKSVFIILTFTILFLLSCSPKKPVSKKNSSIPSQLVKNDVVPPPPIVTQPAYNPFTTAGQFTVSGVCNSDNMVSISGASLQAVKCVNSTFEFAIHENADANYAYYLSQKSPSGLVSSKSTFVWIRSQSVNPVEITSPPRSPYVSNQQNINISGACTPGMHIAISGDLTDSMECDANSQFAFTTSNTTEGTYSYDIIQTDHLVNMSSAPFSITLVLDKTAPNSPSLTIPAANPYISSDNTASVTISCEEGATIVVTGSKLTTGECISGTFTFSDSQSAIGTYNYLITQTDLAGNISTSMTFQWVYTGAVMRPVFLNSILYSFFFMRKESNIKFL
jgi:hypothetical protein